MTKTRKGRIQIVNAGTPSLITITSIKRLETIAQIDNAEQLIFWNHYLSIYFMHGSKLFNIIWPTIKPKLDIFICCPFRLSVLYSILDFVL